MIHLASRSATRAALLELAGVPFAVVGTACNEAEEKARLLREGTRGSDLAARLAALKARGAELVGGGLVLGADQVLETEDGGLLDKPASLAEAKAQLTKLSGRSHRLHSAAVVVRDGREVWSGIESVTMRMRPLGPPFLDDYLASEYEHVRWNVGAYRIEGPGVQLFDRIDGSHFAILGLPLLPLLAFLRDERVLAS